MAYNLKQQEINLGQLFKLLEHLLDERGEIINEEFGLHEGSEIIMQAYDAQGIPQKLVIHDYQANTRTTYFVKARRNEIVWYQIIRAARISDAIHAGAKATFALEGKRGVVLSLDYLPEQKAYQIVYRIEGELGVHTRQLQRGEAISVDLTPFP